MRFDSRVQVIAGFPAFSQAELREEISQARTSIETARTGGAAHRAFIDALPEAWRADPSVEIFSRLLWLKEGWYPLGPHYHLDWHLGPGGPIVETRMVLLGGASRTEFVIGELDLPDPIDPAASPDRERVTMDRWARHIAEGVAAGRYATWHAEPEQLFQFDNRTWHRARPARSTGWRLLMRAIRGLPTTAGPDGRAYPKAGPFTTARNGYVPETAEEEERYAPYRR